MDHRVSFLPSPKAVFCPVLEWHEGVHDEAKIMGEVLDAINQAGNTDEGKLIRITQHTYEYLTYLHGHSSSGITPRLKLINEESFAAVDKRLREGHRITLVRASSGLRQLRHPVLNLLHNEDVITPLYYGYLILRKHAQTPQDLGYFLVQGTI